MRGVNLRTTGLAFGLAAWLLSCLLARADDFSDVSVSAHAIYTGNTFHGYAEMRISVENRSDTKSHSVTLIYPNNGYSSGNSINRLERTVSLAPGAREVVSLLQPPLPSRGDGNLRVEVDGRREGEVRGANVNSHCEQYSRGGVTPTVLVSRSLDFDAVTRIFRGGSDGYTADKATGPPDSRGRGPQPNSWMPDTRIFGSNSWLELDYLPQLADRFTIYATEPVPRSGEMTLMGAAGTNLETVRFSTGSSRPWGSGFEMEIATPSTGQPIQTVRLDFGKVSPGAISIDAVEMIGPSGSQWATAARASSDNRLSGPTFSPGMTTPNAVQTLRAESPVGEWSENWLAYTPFDAVILSAADVSTLPPAVFAALGDYLHAGGNLVVLGQDALPAAWHAGRAKPLADCRLFDVGFGSLFALNTGNPTALDSKTIEQMGTAVRTSAQYFQGLPSDSDAANNVLPVVQNLKIPTRGIVIVMLGFMILIGPANIIYLNRIKRRTWMLWTIPAISFATTLLVFAYSLLREGITPDTRIAGLTVLDQASHRAATIGAEAFYCPLTPSGGLQFDFNTEATPLVELGYGSGGARDVDWTHSQHFQHGWVSARVPAHFHLRKAETRRERIQIYHVNGKLQVVNSLGAPIKSIWYANSNMEAFAANNIPAGEKAPMEAVTAFDSEESGAKGLWRTLGFAAPTDSAPAAEKYLQPNTYLAVLDGNPFLENGLGPAASAKRTRSSCIVFGIMDAPEQTDSAPQ